MLPKEVWHDAQGVYRSPKHLTRRPAAFREKLPDVPVWSTEESGAVPVVFTEDGFELKTQSGT